MEQQLTLMRQEKELQMLKIDQQRRLRMAEEDSSIKK